MPNATMSALVRKKEAPKPAPGAEFAALLKVVGKTSDAVFESLLQGDVETRTRGGGSRRLASHLAGASDPGIYYWTFDETGAPAALFLVSNGFAAALTERLLGGPLPAPEAESPYTMLHADMAAAFIDVMAPALNAAFAKAAPEIGEEAIGGKAFYASPALAMAEREEIELAAVAFDLSFGGGEAPAAATVLFSRALLERCGLVETGSEAASSPTDSGWGDGLKRNLMTAELRLSAVAARLPSTVGALSQLEVGQVIGLDAGALADLDLVAETAKGSATVARGRLGAWRGRKAVKLTTAIDRDFIEGL